MGGGGGLGMEDGRMDGWMERKHSGGRIPRTQAMKPKHRAHDSDRFTVLGKPSRNWRLMGSDSTAGSPAVRRRTVTQHRTPADGRQ